MIAAVPVAYRLTFAACSLAVLAWTFRDGFPTKARTQLRFTRLFNRPIAERPARVCQVITIAGIGVWLAFMLAYVVFGVGG